MSAEGDVADEPQAASKRKASKMRSKQKSKKQVDAAPGGAVGAPGGASKQRSRTASNRPAVAEELLEYRLTPEHCQTVRTFLRDFVAKHGTMEDAGDQAYAHILANLSPDVRRLFVTPGRVTSLRVISNIDRMATLAERREELDAEILAMSMRHIGYISPELYEANLAVFRDTLISSVRNSLDEEWTDLAEQSFTLFFNYLGFNQLAKLSEFSGKVKNVRHSWNKLISLKKDDKGNPDLERLGGFGDALYFNVGVMSPDIMLLMKTPKDQLATLFAKFFHKIVEIISDPQVLSEELYILGARHLTYGTEDQHFPVFGQAVMVTLRSLLPRDWSWDHEEAWTWLWSTCADQLSRYIKAGHVNLANINSAMIEVDKFDISYLALAFYRNLFAMSIDVQSYFYKPVSIIKFILGKVLELCSSMLKEPDATAFEVRSVGMRHIKYGIPVEYFPLFGTSLRKTLTTYMGEKYTASIDGSFADVFEFIRGCMSRAVQTGTTLVTVAMVQNSVDRLTAALDEAPRALRANWMLEVRVGGIKVSPLFWSIQDGKVDVARVMLSDLLAIRADRNTYYCGIDELFSTHMDLVAIFCQLAPELIPELLEGLMWHSGQIEDGHRRVNYFIRDLYGDPHKPAYKDAFATPLSDLVRHGDANVFAHPVARFLVDLKWRQFGFARFLTNQLLQLVLVGLFMAGYVIMDLYNYPSDRWHATGPIDVSCTADEFALFGQPNGLAAGTCRCLPPAFNKSVHGCVNLSAFVVRAVGFAFSFLTMVGVQVPRLVSELRNNQVVKVPISSVRGWSVPIPFFFLKSSNSLRLVLNVLFLVAFFCDPFLAGALVPIGRRHTTLVVYEWCVGISGVLIWILALEIYSLSFVFSALHNRLMAMLPTLTAFTATLLFLIMGFGTAIYVSEHKHDDEHLVAAHTHAYLMQHGVTAAEATASVEKAYGAGMMAIQEVRSIQTPSFSPDEYFSCNVRAGAAMLTTLEKNLAKVDGREPRFSEFHPWRAWVEVLLSLFSASVGTHVYCSEELGTQQTLLYVSYTLISVAVLLKLLMGLFADKTQAAASSALGLTVGQRAGVVVELESSFALKGRQKLWNGMKLGQRIEFDEGDVGLAGGIQVLESLAGQTKHRDNRIVRYPGDCSPKQPWPRLNLNSAQGTREKSESILSVMEKTAKMVNLIQKSKDGATTGAGSNVT